MKNAILFFVFYNLLLWSNPTDSFSWERHQQETLQLLPNIHGWCTQEKAQKLMDLIYVKKPIQCVEIGTLGGSVTFPILRSLQFLRRGVVFAIDAWDMQISLEGLDPANKVWWQSLNINMDQTYQYFLSWLDHLQLKNYCHVLRMRSDQAVEFFADDSIDLLYIDGSFSTEGSLQDAVLYFPKVKEGGYIWLDHSDLESKNKATAFLMKHCEWIREDSIGIGCLLFKKPKATLEGVFQ